MHSPYQGYIDWMLSCRATINSGCGRMLKGKVNEAALAGCLLFEDECRRDGGTVPHYLTPSKATDAFDEGTMPDGDYLEFHDPQDVVRVMERPDYADLAMVMGNRLKRRVLRDYGPAKFWHKVING